MTTKLKNGATIIDQRGDVVLAKTDGVHPFVTWCIDDAGNAYWGHYHATLTEAVAEFEERAGNYDGSRDRGEEAAAAYNQA